VELGVEVSKIHHRYRHPHVTHRRHPCRHLAYDKIVPRRYRARLFLISAQLIVRERHVARQLFAHVARIVTQKKALMAPVEYYSPLLHRHPHHPLLPLRHLHLVQDFLAQYPLLRHFA
jgi:hypothetical protein